MVTDFWLRNIAHAQHIVTARVLVDVIVVTSETATRQVLYHIATRPRLDHGGFLLSTVLGYHIRAGLCFNEDNLEIEEPSLACWKCVATELSGNTAARFI